MKRVACSVTAFILATVIAEQLLGDVAVYFEMWSVGASSRAELADDFGLGLLWLLIVLPGSIIVGAISSWVTWIVLKKRAVVTVRTHNQAFKIVRFAHWDLRSYVAAALLSPLRGWDGLCAALRLQVCPKVGR